MKKIILLCFLSLAANTLVKAQNIIWQDDFNGNNNWSEFEYKKQGSAFVKDGVLTIKCEEDNTFISKCRTNLNGNRDFSIHVEAVSKSGLKEDMFFGLVVNYLDRKNYTVFAIEKGFAYFIECKNGIVVREDYDLIKNTKAKSFTLELRKTGNNVVFVVNGEETLDLDQVEIMTNIVGLYVKGKAEVAFDNLIIKQ